MKYKIILVLYLLYPSLLIYASDLEFDENAIANRKNIEQVSEYKIEDSLVEDYGVEDIFTDKESSLDGKYTTENLFEGGSQEVSLVSGEFDDIFIEDISYHDIYIDEEKNTLIYKVIGVILLIGISYMLTQVYLIIRYRRRNAKDKVRK